MKVNKLQQVYIIKIVAFMYDMLNPIKQEKLIYQKYFIKKLFFQSSRDKKNLMKSQI